MFDDDAETAIAEAIHLAHPGALPEVHSFPEGHGTELTDFLAVRVERPVPHWLFVSRGFTELGEKIEEDPDLSGWGFELTCRLPLHAGERDVAWVRSAMLGVSRYLADKITFLEAFNSLPIGERPEGTSLSAVVVVDDIVLRRAESKNGQFVFFQMVGLTEDEYEALGDWDAASIVELIRERDPHLFTDPTRASRMAEPNFARSVNAGRERDGSSVGVLYGVPVLWRLIGQEIELHLSTEAVPVFVAAMRRRLAHGNGMLLFGDRRKSIRADGSIAIRSQVNVSLYPEEGRSAVERADGTPTAVLRFGTPAIARLESVLSKAPGTYALPELPRVRFVVVTPERFRDPAYPGLTG